MNLRFAANLTMLYTEVPFLDRFALAAEAGFAAVEFLFPYQEGIEEIRSRIDDLGLTVVLFDVPPGDLEAGELGTLANPLRKDHFHWSLAHALEVADRLKCQRLNVLAGNRLSAFEHAAQIDCVVGNLMWAAPQAADAGVTLMIEPLNAIDRPDYLIHTTVAAMEIVRGTDHPHVRLQYDVYHAQMGEGNLINTMSSHFPSIGHVQIADVPGRHEPGTGEINYAAIFATLEALAYRGYTGLEYTPSRETNASLDWLQADLGKRA